MNTAAIRATAQATTQPVAGFHYATAFLLLEKLFEFKRGNFINAENTSVSYESGTTECRYRRLVTAIASNLLTQLDPLGTLTQHYTDLATDDRQVLDLMNLADSFIKAISQE